MRRSLAATDHEIDSSTSPEDPTGPRRLRDDTAHARPARARPPDSADRALGAPNPRARRRESEADHPRHAAASGGWWRRRR